MTQIGRTGRRRFGRSARGRSALGAVAVLVGTLAVALPGGNARAADPAQPAAEPCPAGLALHDYQEPGGQLLHVGTPSCPLGSSNSRLIDVTFTTGYVQPNSNVSPAHPQVDQPGARIILPADYGSNPAKRYPVLYLLHGGNDSYRSWTGADADGQADKGKAYSVVTANAAANSGLIVVMPSTSKLGYYSDWYGATVANKRPMFESHHIKQLIPWVDANFRTWASKDGRAIAGLSMGGYGAMKYAKKYPSKFAAVASFSGALDIEDKGRGPFFRITAGRLLDLAYGSTGQGDPANLFGPTWNGLTGQGSGPNWEAQNPIRNLDQYKGLDVTNFTGANDISVPRSDRRHCEIRQYSIGVAIGEAILESAVCVGAEQFDTALRASGAVPASSYWYQEFPGRLHNFKAWDEYLGLWLPRLMTKVTPAGS